jgi:hypothetical protein
VSPTLVTLYDTLTVVEFAVAFKKYFAADGWNF